jgi:ornithine carbamoyltransferase
MVLSRFNKVILARVFGHADVAELAEHSSVPGKTASLFISIVMNAKIAGQRRTNFNFDHVHIVSFYYCDFLHFNIYHFHFTVFPIVFKKTYDNRVNFKLNIPIFTVINALSDLHHPLQTLADLMTLKEHFGDLKGKTVAWVGDGNNVLHDLMVGAIKMGMNMNISTPKGYEANPTLIAQAKILADQVTFFFITMSAYLLYIR